MSEDGLERELAEVSEALAGASETKSKKGPNPASLEGLIDDNLKEVVVPDESKPAADANAPDPGVLDGLVEGATLSEASMETEAQRDLIDSQMGQLEKLEKIEHPNDSESGHDEETDRAQSDDGDSGMEADSDLPTLVPLDAAAAKAIQGPLALETKQVNLEPLRVLEAALFLANKPLAYKQLSDILQLPMPRVKDLLGQLSLNLAPESAVELFMTEHAAALQLKPQYLERVAHLSKEVELSRKSMRILALVAKKKQLLQADLKHFFKGEIYAYVTELKNAGYLDSKKHGNTRLLKPSAKFFDSFQFKE